MIKSTSSFRKTAFALTTAAALAVFGAFPAAAQQVATNEQAAAACASVTDANEHAACMVRALNKHIVDTKRDTARLNASTACMEDVSRQIAAAKKIGPLSPDQKTMFKAQIERCDKG